MENYYLMAISGLLVVIGFLLTVLWGVNSRDRKITLEYERRISELQKQHSQEITTVTNLHADEITKLEQEKMDIKSKHAAEMTNIQDSHSKIIADLKTTNRELSEQINQLQFQQGSPPKDNSGNSWMSNSLRNLSK